MTDSVKYKEFVVRLEWAEFDDKWFIQAHHKSLGRSEGLEPSLLLAEDAAAEGFGKLVARVLFPSDVGTRLHEELERIRTRDRAGLRIVIELPEKDDNPPDFPFDLHGVAWEAARLGAGRTYLFAEERVSIVRRWESSAEDLFDAHHRKLIFLDASGGSNNAGPLESDIPDLSWESLGIYDDPVPNVASLTALANENVAIFHFTGHGDSDRLVLEGKPVGIELLSSSLKNTRLAVLSACGSAGASSLLHRTGLAQELAKSVPAVIGMSLRVEDTVAEVFSGELYGNLVAGLSLDEAVRRGRLKLLERETHTLAFTLPIFYLGVTGSTTPTPSQAVVQSPAGNMSLLVEPLAVIRGKNSGTVHGIQSSRSGLRIVKLERAGTSPALLASDARVAASVAGGQLTIGDILSGGIQPDIESTTVSLPTQFAQSTLLAVARGYRSSTVRIVMANADTTTLLSRGHEWHPPRTLDAEFAAAAALDTNLGVFLLDGAGGQITSVPGGSAVPFSLPSVSGFDFAYSSGVGLAVAWGQDGAKTAVEVQRWDERPGALRFGEPQWIEVDLDPSFDPSGVVRVGVVRELSQGAAPHAVAVQRGESIELFTLRDTGSSVSRTR